MPLSAELLRAYRETHYRVIGERPFTLLVDTFSAQLRQLHRTRQVDNSAFVTAFNPHGQRLGGAENSACNARLAQQLERAGYQMLPGVGQPADGSDWQAEASFLVLGIGLEEARGLGREFEQNAIVWAGADAIPRLQILV